MTGQDTSLGGHGKLERLGNEGSPLVIASILRPTGRTGVHTHIKEFQAFLNETSIPSTVVTPFSLSPLLSAPVFAVRLALERFSGSASVVWYRYFHQEFLRMALYRHLRSLDEAVIYAQGPVEARAALLARSGPHQRVVLAIHFQTSQADEWARKGEIPERGHAYRSIRRFETEVVQQVDAIVFVSHASRKDFLSWLPEAAAVPSAVIHNFVAPIPCRPSESLGDLVTIGGLEITKNHRFLLHVLDRARRMGSPLTLDLYGDGSCRRDLEHLTSSLGLREYVRFHGHRSNVREFLPSYRMYVHASYAEALPLVIIEAMAAGLPVVTTSAGGAPELCRDGIEGRLWSLDDPCQAAQLLLDLIGDEAKRSAAGAASYKRYKEYFHAEVVAPRLYNFLMQSTRPPINGLVDGVGGTPCQRNETPIGTFHNEA